MCTVAGDPHIWPFSNRRFSNQFTADTVLYSSTTLTISATGTTAGWTNGATEVNGVTVTAMGTRVSHSRYVGFDTSVSIPGVEITRTEVKIVCSRERVIIRVDDYWPLTITGHTQSTTGLCTLRGVRAVRDSNTTRVARDNTTLGCPAEFRDECEFDMANNPSQASRIIANYETAVVDRNTATNELNQDDGKTSFAASA